MSNIVTLLSPNGDEVFVDEGESSEINGTFKDLDGNTIDGASVNTLTLTLKDELTGQVINGRDDQNILNVNGGTVDGDGNFTLALGPLDSAVITPTETLEAHLLIVTWTWTDMDLNQQTGSQVWRMYVAPTPFSPSVPATPERCAVTVIVRDQFGEPLKQAMVSAVVTEAVTVANKATIMSRPVARLTNTNGAATLNLIKGGQFETGYSSEYTISIKTQSGDEKSFEYTVPDQDSATAPVIV